MSLVCGSLITRTGWREDPWGAAAPQAEGLQLLSPAVGAQPPAYGASLQGRREERAAFPLAPPASLPSTVMILVLVALAHLLRK